MHFSLSKLAIAATLLASANALSSSDIPLDTPVSSLLSSAQGHLSKGETTEALLYYDAAIAKDPKNYLTFFKRATTYLSLGRTNQATDDFNRVLSLKPRFEGAHLQLARIKGKAGDWDGAKASYTAASRGPDSEEFKILEESKVAAHLATIAAKEQKWDECVEHSGFAIQTASRASSLRELRARCRFERGEVEEGMNDLRHVLVMKPGDTTPHVLISATTFYGLGDLDNGLAQIRKCLHSDPDSKVCKKLHRQEKQVQKAYTKIKGQLSRGQFTTAGRALVGTADEPGLVPDVRQQTEELQKNGHIPSRSRIGLLDEVIELTCQAYAESNHKEAPKYCDEALSLNPDSFWGLVHRGKTLLKNDEFEQAINSFNRAAEVRPDLRDKVNPLLNKAQVALKRSKSKDYYKVLSVANDADERQIKAAYRKATKQFHPDKAVKQGITKEEAEKKMASINEAYEVLSDPELRARFDRGDDPNSNERENHYQGNPFGGGGQQFMFQGFPGGGGGQHMKFQFGGF